MRFRQNSRNKDLNLDLTSLIDVVFVLMIFFMVTTSFDNSTKLSLKLPEVERDYDNSKLKSLNLMVTEKGGYFLNDSPLINNQKKTLISAITNTVGDNRELAFTIAGDAKAPHQAIVTALDVAGELGFSQVKIAAVKSH